jgi:hypothetical protein
MIQHALENFDFETMHRVMEFLEWEWADGAGRGDGVMSIPSAERLRAVAEEALRQLVSDPDRMATCTGGLKVSRSFSGDRMALHLEFVAVWYDGFMDGMSMEEAHP